jgi:succinate-semialdehyde dehydrogenase/glutarate-semialdehyde dehydrogenase
MAGVPTDLYIAGEWSPASDGSRFDVADPSTGNTLATVASGTVDDGLRAVAAAADALEEWSATPPRARGEILRTAFELMVQRADDIATVIVLESGKSWSDAAGEVRYAAEFFRWFSEEAVRAAGMLATAPGGDKRIMTVLQPVGVAVLVTPWNFPAAMATRKIGPALAAGCTVVLKPASDTPLTALMVAHLLEEAGVPPGVVNVVPSRRSGAIVEAMLTDPRTRKLSFTGSTEVGRTLLGIAARNVVNCSMELGGNGPFVVFADADIEAAVEGAMVAKMRNGGESCIAANRFLVQAPAVDAFARRLGEEMGRLVVGPGLDRNTDVGPLINEAAVAEISSLVDRSIGAGAEVVTGGHSPDRAGWYYPPTVLKEVGADDPILGHEIFGPVAPVVGFDTEDEAVAMANSTEYGLAGYVYSADLSRALRVAERLEVGMVGVNRGFISDPAAPFGGVKQSGLGREGGHEGLLEFLEQKYIAVSW